MTSTNEFSQESHENLKIHDSGCFCNSCQQAGAILECTLHVSHGILYVQNMTNLFSVLLHTDRQGQITTIVHHIAKFVKGLSKSFYVHPLDPSLQSAIFMQQYFGPDL